MLADGEVGPAQTLEARLEEPEIRSVAKEVEHVESQELNELCRLYERGDPRVRFASRVTIVQRDGTAFDSGLVECSFPYPDWSGRKMEDKFRWLVRFVLDDERIDRLLDILWCLEDLSSVRQLTQLVNS
jgi:hypothetical protein